MKRINKRQWGLKNSMFFKLIILYCVISVVSIFTFCIIWLLSTYQELRLQTQAYNAQQMESLYLKFETQNNNLKQTQYRAYTYQIDPELMLDQQLFNYFDAVRKYSSLMPAQKTQADNNKIMLANYILQTEQPRRHGMALFMFSANVYTGRDLFVMTSTGTTSPKFTREILEQVMKQSSLPSRRYTHIIPSLRLTGDDGITRDFFVVYDKLRVRESPVEDFGYVIHVYSPELFNDILRKYNNSFVGRAYILDNNGNIIYDTQGTDYGNPYKEFTSINSKKDGSYTRNGKEVSVLYHDLYSFYVVGETHTSDFIKYSSERYIPIFTVGVLAIIFTLYLSVWATRSSQRRMAQLLQTLFQARTNVKVRAPVTGANDELDMISKDFNKMLAKLEIHLRKSYQAEIDQQAAMIRQRETELYALQSQIDPHFLYNSLETIRMSAVMHNDADTSLMIKELAELFRNRIKSSNVVMLSQELDFCASVMQIYNNRYNGNVELKILIDASLYSCVVLRDILTPLLENVMVHAFSTSHIQNDMQIELSGEVVGSNLFLRVQDNGQGMPMSSLEKLRATLQKPVLQSSTHIGLMNLHNRLRLVYGEEYGLQIYSSENDGTTAVVKMKLLSTEELTEAAQRHL